MKSVEWPTIGDRLAALVEAVDRYDLLSNGLRDEVRKIVAGGPDEVGQLESEDLARVLFEIVNLFRWRRLEPLLALHDVPHPRYPVGETAPPSNPPPIPLWDPPSVKAVAGGWKVLGLDVGFPIGVPSCELTRNADWIEYYARKGFHVLTYRTVRNRPVEASPYEWVFLANLRTPCDAADMPTAVTGADDSVPRDWRTASTATSFVAPCPTVDVWFQDMRDARSRLDALGGHHLLIASVTDSVPLEKKSLQTLTDDFVQVAKTTESAGAHVVECDLARAITRGADGAIRACEQEVETSLTIVEALRNSLVPDTRLVIKLSGEVPLDRLEQIVLPLAKAHLIDGVSGISPARVQRVMQSDGQTLWEEPRPEIAGWAVRQVSRAFVERPSYLRLKHGLHFEIIAMGGIMSAEDVFSHLKLGAAAVQVATAAASDPGLAVEAFARYRPRIEATEEWDGVVVEEVDRENGTFWARLYRADGEAADDEVQFNLTDFGPHDRDEIAPGTIFRWQTESVFEGDERVERSMVWLRRLPAPSQADVLRAKRLAAKVADLFGP